MKQAFTGRFLMNFSGRYERMSVLPYRILCVLSNFRLNNGVANCMMNYYEAMRDMDITVDFLCLEHIDSPFADRIKGGSKYFVLPERNYKATKRNSGYIKSIFRNEKYDAVHVNIVYGVAVRVLKEAKRAGVKVRIIHAHNPKETLGIKNTVRFYRFNYRTNFYATHYLACTETAGRSLFGKRKFTVLRNAVNAERFRYDGSKRQDYRDKLGIADKFVLGTSCRFALQKNPFFIVDVFAKLREFCPDTVLLWAGCGDMYEQIKKYIEDKGLSGSVMLLGNREDMGSLYCTMDAFFLPSLYEGLGMVFIEAQVSGLYCFASDKVPRDTHITDRITYISLKNDAEYWAEKIFSVCGKERCGTDRRLITESGYDIEHEKYRLAEYNLKCIGEIK